jgi:PAS domain S-box-containing protein
MKHLTFLDSDKSSLEHAIKKAKASLYKSQLVQIFTGLSDKKDIQKILDRYTKKFPHAIIIGATTAGEISHAKMYEKQTVVSVTFFKKSTLEVTYSEKITKSAGIKLSQKIAKKTTKALLLLSEGMQGEDYEGFIKGIKEQNPKMLVAGGLAGDNFQLKKTFVFLDDKIYTRGSVAVSFSGKKLNAQNRYNLNWEPIGKDFIISKAEGNIVYEIEGVKAVDFFTKYLGKEVFDNNASNLPDFQLLYQDGLTVVARTPMSVEQKSLVFAGPIKEGQRVQFGFSNAASVILGSESIRDKMLKKPAQAIYIYSCIARKTLLGKTLENEFYSFEDIAPTAGFFTYGEYYSTSENNALLNCTSTLLLLSEGNKSRTNKKKPSYFKSINLDDTTFRALTHFIKETSLELKENVKLLNQYKDVVDSSSLVSKTDLNGVITFVNDNFCSVSKYSKEELIGQEHNIIRDEEMSSFIYKKLWSRIQTGKVWRGKISNRAKDGSIYYVDATVMPIFDKNGKIDEYIAVRRDITQEILSKNKLKTKEKLIKAIFDNQDNIVIYASKTKGMLNANKTLFEYFSYKDFDDFKQQQKCICDLFIREKGYVDPQTMPHWLNDIADNPQDDFKVKILAKDGEVKIFAIRVRKIDDEYIINLSDITKLEKALIKAYASQEAKSTFLANMSHEIRTPLNGILGFTSILGKKELDKDTKRYIDIIHSSGETLLNVVNDILDFSKIESGKLSLHEDESNLFKELESSVATFASSAKLKHIDFFTFIDPNIPQSLECDIQRIKQVMNNLLSNAIKFTPDHGVVSVNIMLKEIIEKKAYLFFSVKDSGIGIAKEKQTTIFSAFSQADNSISREFGGTGLGLAISSKYIDMMQSTLALKSEEGEGSEFYFELALPIVNKLNSLTKESTNKINIAILDSENRISCGINEIVTTYLKAWAYEYKLIYSLGELDEESDILIVCAKLFDDEHCKNALDRLQKLELIYVEGGDDRFECMHPKFHVINQPMTGSVLFDNIISISQAHLLKTEMLIKEEIKQYEKNSILVAEDNETNQLLISILLQERGLEYTIVSNGEEAVKEALKNAYDIIFMDINMPILDGVSATKMLREKAYDKTIVSLSADVLEEDIKKFKLAGVNDTLNKPIVPDELDAILLKYLQDFDAIDVRYIKEALKLSNEDVVFVLLKSFTKAAEKIIVKLQNEPYNKDILHTLKGLSGNMRFSKLFAMVKKMENNFIKDDDKQKVKNRDVLILHLEHLIMEIEK